MSAFYNVLIKEKYAHLLYIDELPKNINIHKINDYLINKL